MRRGGLGGWVVLGCVGSHCLGLHRAGLDWFELKRGEADGTGVLVITCMPHIVEGLLLLAHLLLFSFFQRMSHNYCVQSSVASIFQSKQEIELEEHCEAKVDGPEMSDGALLKSPAPAAVAALIGAMKMKKLKASDCCDRGRCSLGSNAKDHSMTNGQMPLAIRFAAGHPARANSAVAFTQALS